jgi:hypothetical protein
VTHSRQRQQKTGPRHAQLPTGRRQSPGSTWPRCLPAPPASTSPARGWPARSRGFGKLWQKTYQARLPGDLVSPTELIALWKQRFPEFWSEGNHFYGPLTGIAPGEVALIEGTLPGKLRLSTGVMVLYADEESFTLMTPEGHVFAGWITFSAAAQDGATVAQAQVLMRASDPIFELGMMLGGHRQEDSFWNTTLRNVAGHYGIADPVVDTASVCVDKHRQWRRWTNVWQSAAIRSTFYMLNAPFRALAGRANGH